MASAPAAPSATAAITAATVILAAAVAPAAGALRIILRRIILRRKKLRRRSVGFGLAFFGMGGVRIVVRFGEMRVGNFFSSNLFDNAGLLVVREGIVMRRFVLEGILGDFFAVGLVQRKDFLMHRGGVSQRLAGKQLDGARGSGRISRSSGRQVRMRMTVIVVFQIFENVADVEEGIAIEADIHECRLHAGENAGDFAFVNAADEGELFFTLDINFY
jgi:hypothetical protein